LGINNLFSIMSKGPPEADMFRPIISSLPTAALRGLKLFQLLS